VPKKSPKELARQRAQEAGEKEKLARSTARESLTTLQFYIGISLIASAIFGIYLLATDQSLWILAASHAYGLVAIVGIDLLIGVLSLMMIRRILLYSIAAALFGILLQVGDIATASQYGMAIAYFANYLFGLWAFDALIAAQASVLGVAVFTRVHVRTLTKQGGRYTPEFSASRRQFLEALMAFAGLVGLAALFSVLEQSRPALPTTPTMGLPAGAIANSSQVTPGNPAYFDFPTNYPNILLKKSDGSLLALSMLCTHVCCQLSYDPGSDQLYCPCHGSLFDSTGNVIQGPAGYPLPTVQLTVDSNGNVFPQKVNGYSPCSQG
jgi:cytochrome b6-f complex iron-sulfur subunit